MSDEELQESELGTREYWDKRYENEVYNYKNHGDVGDIWFGEDIAERIVRWIEQNISKTASILDVGSGNGMLLVDLANSGYERLMGVDYSQGAIALAEEIIKNHNVNVKLIHCDILEESQLENNNFDVILDKGTYDAISLMKDSKATRNKYLKNIFKYLKDDGLFIITSCNWTKDELEGQFQSLFKVHSVIPTPEFKFGGKTGSVVSSVVFCKR